MKEIFNEIWNAPASEIYKSIFIYGLLSSFIAIVGIIIIIRFNRKFKKDWDEFHDRNFPFSDKRKL